MKTKSLLAGTLFGLLALPAIAQQTPGRLVESYDALADSLLALRRLEAGFVGALLDHHRRAAEALMRRGDYEGAAAEMALFASEGDNAVSGIRKRLVEGGHHHSAAGEARGDYEPGFVIVTREAKQKILAASAALRDAESDDERQRAWRDFAATAERLLIAG